ncbi:EF_hand domain-containing protein [Hexamita inflata]|uniref:EF hand domain-containing protein n=1 Tax=Hexamita inflata TaxID=28002 RepID=A0AA86RBW4_9EUKA|nr:EF hand domain-containing protein [Hexamita inflata]
MIADDQKTKKLEFHEVKQFIYAVLNSSPQATVTFLFFVKDKDESGTIEHVELFKILKKAGSKATEEQVKEYMKHQIKADSKCVDLKTLPYLPVLQLFQQRRYFPVTNVHINVRYYVTDLVLSLDIIILKQNSINSLNMINIDVNIKHYMQKYIK